ncbi:TetR/AcrR family transcriptional regulator [Bifidobacterium felsineum]|uniref:AcrR family transcriptional regulator n=1 Tax=Bifidobacterium felsineum TaxID=2045440 RepID=A0A2M9HMI5_9BIFI|nr:helix-turn-helix domain-containing protein [Bifidobacterium felsineum]MBT1164214.1 TetR/AcrR family transcriptional regulator [Bifidobacterium felsineum]PJM78017.1 AcrR family transcriptional regulator [Bifidobacterium felsineum]
MSSTSPNTQTDDRRNAIIEATVESFGKLGYYGTSLQRIATEVGLTKAGVLHYVGSKEGLLELVLGEVYDKETIALTAGMVTEDRPLIPDMLRRVVAVNAKRPSLVHMFSTLSAEALDSGHPAHAYFADRERQTVANAQNINWSVPNGVNVEHVLQAAFSMMDGIQLRWLRSPGQDLNVMWTDCEEVLFPLPIWNGYR